MPIARRSKSSLAIGLLLATVSCLVLVPTAAAQKIWTPVADNKWGDPANWNPAGEPGLTDIARFTANSFGAANNTVDMGAFTGAGGTGSANHNVGRVEFTAGGNSYTFIN